MGHQNRLTVASEARNAASMMKVVFGLVAVIVLTGVGSALGGTLGGVAGFLVAVLLYFSIVIDQEYERAVVFRLGSYNRVLGAGLQFKIPFVEWVQKIDYRVKTVNVKPQKVLTKDNVTVTVDAIVFYKIKREDEEVQKAVLEVEDFNKVTVNYGQTMLRAIIGKKELDDILQNRDEIADELRKELDKATNDFGVHIRDVEIQDVSIPDSMERAMAAEAEAERSRRAKIKEAEGELQAAAEMRAAADILGKGGYQLRMLETLDRVAQENATIVTIPAELIPQQGEMDTPVEDSPVKEIIDRVLGDRSFQDLMPPFGKKGKKGEKGGAKDADEDAEQ